MAAYHCSTSSAVGRPIRSTTRPVRPHRRWRWNRSGPPCRGPERHRAAAGRSSFGALDLDRGILQRGELPGHRRHHADFHAQQFDEFLPELLELPDELPVVRAAGYRCVLHRGIRFAANRAAFNAILADKTVVAFEKGAVNRTAVEAQVQSYRKGFRLDQLRVMAP